MDLPGQYAKLGDKQLFNIASNEEKWTAEARQVAYQELLNRSYSVKQVEVGIRQRQTIIARSLERTRLQREQNSTEGYSWKEAAIVILTFPLTLIFFKNLLSEFVRLQDYGYRRKIWQRLILIAVSFLIWLAVIVNSC